MSTGIDDSNLLGPVCTFCSRLRLVSERTCNAFPKGIPDVIWKGLNDHKDPFPGDNGIQFQWADGVDPE